MDDDSCGKFIGSLTKYLQSLCHSYVDFDNGVELVGHIYLNVDTGKKIDYVLNESVCKNGANVVKFTSNSYHAQPVEKAKKETPKKAPDPPPKAAEKKKNDEDDVIIVGSEGGRRNRQGTSPIRSQHSSPNQMMRGNVAGQNRLAQAQAHQAQGNLFRQPRGPNPRVAGPVPRAGGYTYQPRQRLTYPQQPRNIMNMGAGYNPRMRQPHYPQTHGVRGSSPIDTDITFMREEYVAGQPNHRGGAQPGVQQQGYSYQPRGAPPHMQPQQQPQQPSHMVGGQQRYMTPPYTQPHTTMPGPMTSGPLTSLAVGQQHQQQQQQQPPVTSLAPAGGPHPPQEAAAGATIFHPSQPAATSVSGGMPLPNTTHTIFDSGPVMSSDLTTGSQPQPELLATSSTPTTGTNSLTESSETAPISSSGDSPGTRGPPSVDTQPGLLIGQVWSESAAAPNPPSSEPQPSSNADSSLPYPGVSSTPPSSTAGLSSPAATTTTITSSASGGSVFDTFNQQPSTSAEPNRMHQSPSHPQHHNQPAPFSSPSHSQAGLAAQNSAGSGSEGDGFSALVSELQAFNQQPGSHTGGNPSQAPSSGGSGNGSSSSGGAPADPFHRSTHPAGSSPGYPTSSSAPSTNTTTQDGSGDSTNFQPHPTSSAGTAEVKRDPGGDIGVNIATSVIHEFTEASASEAPETFLAPYDMGGAGSQGGAGVAQHGGVEAYRKRSGSASSHSHGTPSPSSSNLVGPESVVIETKPFLHHASSDYDSGCDTASASTGERLASPQASHMRNLSIPLVPVDSPTSSSSMNITLKQERPSEDDVDSENVRVASSDWKKAPDSDWITNMSALNNSDDSTESSDDAAQDDDDPNYTPGKRFGGEKGTGKRTRSKHTEKGHKGKKRKVDSSDSEGGGGGEDHSVNMDVPAEPEDTNQPPYQSPEQLPDLDQPLDSEQQQEGGSSDSPYKPGTFILVNVSKESERSSRTRPSHTPAEVIVTPEGQPEGVWVHTLVPAGNGLWRLPSVDQMVDIHVEPEDIVKTLDHANVRIVGTKVFYKFDDMTKAGVTVRKKGSTPKQNRKK